MDGIPTQLFENIYYIENLSDLTVRNWKMFSTILYQSCKVFEYTFSGTST